MFCLFNLTCLLPWNLTRTRGLKTLLTFTMLSPKKRLFDSCICPSYNRVLTVHVGARITTAIHLWISIIPWRMTAMYWALAISKSHGLPFLLIIPVVNPLASSIDPLHPHLYISGVELSVFCLLSANYVCIIFSY